MGRFSKSIWRTIFEIAADRPPSSSVTSISTVLHISTPVRNACYITKKKTPERVPLYIRGRENNKPKTFETIKKRDGAIWNIRKNILKRKRAAIKSTKCGATLMMVVHTSLNQLTLSLSLPIKKKYTHIHVCCRWNPNHHSLSRHDAIHVQQQSETSITHKIAINENFLYMYPSWRHHHHFFVLFGLLLAIVHYM